MSAPIIWIFFPLLMGLVCWQLVRTPKWRIGMVVGTAALLAILAKWLPVSVAVNLGPVSFKINETIALFGRQFSLSPADMPFLTLIYSQVALFVTVSGLAKAPENLPPFGLLFVALLVAALSVEPFLYAALLIEVAVLLSVAFLSPVGQQPGRGLMRYIIFQTMAVPFILLTGWMLQGTETGPASADQRLQVFILLGLGFALLLAVFPFYSWLPMLGEEAHPYSAGFLFWFLPLAVLFFGLAFLDHYAFIRDSAQVFNALQLIGLLMVLIGGIASSFQDHLGRLMGTMTIFQIGLSLVAISLRSTTGYEIFAAQLFPCFLGLGIYAFALSLLPDVKLGKLAGVGHSLPLESFALLVGQLSLAGLPLLAGFPPRVALMQNIAASSPSAALGVMVGTLGALVAGIRIISTLWVGSGAYALSWSGKRVTFVLMGVGIIICFFFGLYPQFGLPGMISLLNPFAQLHP